MASKRSAFDQVRMENYSVTFWLIQLLASIISYDLTRSKKYQSTFLVIVRVFSVSEIAALYVLQQD